MLNLNEVYKFEFQQKFRNKDTFRHQIFMRVIQLYFLENDNLDVSLSNYEMSITISCLVHEFKIFIQMKGWAFIREWAFIRDFMVCNLDFSIGKSENSVFFRNYCSQ